MAESFLVVLFKVIWQHLVQDVGYYSKQQNWQAIQVVIDEIKKSKQVNQDLTVALEKCFYSSIITIVQQCREELIKNSTFTQYRGAKIYKPADNDKDIRSLENKIKFIEKQLKKIQRPKFFNQSFFSSTQIEEIQKQLSEYYQESQTDIDYKLFEEAEKDCDVNIYKAKLREEENRLQTKIFNTFLREIEPHEELNRIFKARTHLILSQVRNQS